MWCWAARCHARWGSSKVDSYLVQSRSSAGGGPALPALADLIANWKADSLALSDGAAVASWTDSVSGIVAAQGTGASQPTFKANSLNGKGAVNFNGNQFLPIATPGAIATAKTSGNYTVLFVVDNVLSTHGNGCVFGAGVGGNGWQFPANGSQVGRYNGGYLKSAVPATGTAAPATFTTFGATGCTPYAISSGGALERIVVRSSVVHSLSGTLVATADGYAIGSAGATGTTTFNFVGRCYEVIMWKRMLTPVELMLAEVYLCNKYNQPLPWATGNYVVFGGDSQTANVGATAVINGFPYRSAQVAGLSYGQWHNLGIGGITFENNIASTAVEIANLAQVLGVSKRIAYTIFEFVNSWTAGDSAATLYQRHQDFALAVKGVGGVNGNFRGVHGTSLSASATAVADPNAIRASFNSLMDTNAAIFDQYVALHNNTSIGTSGAAAANPTLYFDGVHNSDAGYAVLAPLWDSAIAAAIAMA